MHNSGIIKKENTTFVLIDIQEKLAPAMNNIEQVVSNSNILIKATEILNIPLLVTEQYPNGLGKTTDRITIPSTIKPIEKLTFSCFGSNDFIQELKYFNTKTVVLFGIESHVCVLQTALDAVDSGLTVCVVADATSSRTAENKELALQRLKQSNVFIVSTEMILFQLLEIAGSNEFKSISKLIR